MKWLPVGSPYGINAVDLSLSEKLKGHTNMKTINLNGAELFKNLATFDKDGVSIDLHNDYDCTSLVFDEALAVLKLSFFKH